MSAVTVSTDVEVANMALDLVKEAPITDMGENRAASRWMNRNFVPVRNYVLTMHIWKFAMKRDEIAEDATTPKYDWARRYRKPSDCLRVLPLRRNGLMNGYLVPHQVEGDFILTNESAPLKIRYISVVENVAEWPVHFVEAVAARLAAGIAHFLSGKTAMIEINEERFRQALAAAASIDSAEGSHAQQYATTYDDARYYYDRNSGNIADW